MITTRVDYESQQAVEICGPSSTTHELSLIIGLKCFSSSTPAQLYGLPENCWPAEAAEFDFANAIIDLPMNSKVVPEKNPLKKLDKPLELSLFQFYIIFGEEVADALIEQAVEDAIENGNF